MDEEQRKLIEEGKTPKRRWWQRRQPGNTIFDDDRLKMQALAEVMGEEEDQAKALKAQEDLKKLLDERIAGIKARKAAERVDKCKDCGQVKADTIRTKSGYAYCQECFALHQNGSPKSKAAPDLMRSLMTDLDYVEKGPVTEDELAEVRRSLGLE